MLLTVPLSFDSPRLVSAALVLVLAAAVATWQRRLPAPRAALALAAAGMLALAVAVGGLVWHRAAPREALVMVDLSASTRTAGYRDRATLQRRIAELLGETPYRTVFFSQVNASGEVPGQSLPDLPGDHTVFAPEPAGAVLLFSDGRFELPEFAPPSYIVIDPALDRPDDAAVTRLDLRGQDVAVTVHLIGKPRELMLEGVEAPTQVTVTGPLVVTRKRAAGATRVVARLSPGDAWAENDLLIAPASPPMASERWWVGTSAPDATWKTMPHLPTDPAAWLAPSVVVLENVPINSLSPAQLDRLTQYVRDLGGALLIVGGDHAFAAGAYPGSALESLSPLASSPPRPTEHWMLLADSSGSMNAVAGGAAGPTRWELTSGAIIHLLPELPPDDLVSVGSFADDLHWWVSGQSAQDTAHQAADLPPPGTTPHGATNLQAALQAITDGADASLPKQLLVITDADTEMEHPEALGAAMAKKNIHLHLLAIEDGKALPALRRIIQLTGGTLVQQMNPRQWQQSAQHLLGSALPDRLVTEPVHVRFKGELSPLPERNVQPWNRTWLKPDGRSLGDTSYGGETVSMAAQWFVGRGQVAALAFPATPTEAQALADRISQYPHDPRFRVTWDTGSPLRVTVDAAETNGAWMNQQKLMLEITDASASGGPRTFAIPQVGPGQYHLEVPPPGSPTFVAVQAGGRVLDRIALAGRYAPEFDAIGNDIVAMHELALRTGGRVIEPREHGRIDFRWPRRDVTLQSWMASLGALLIAAALLRWSVKGF